MLRYAASAAGLSLLAAAGRPAAECEKIDKKLLTTGFDPEALERGAKALREISASSNAAKVLELARLQELTRAQELRTQEAQGQAAAASAAQAVERIRWDEQRKTNAAQAQARAQIAQYEDELARGRAAAEHELARERNAEAARMQEAASIRTEAHRRATEDAAQAARRLTDAARAAEEREVVRAKALAEAEGRAAEARATEDVARRLQADRLEGETAKAVAVLRSGLQSAGAGASALLADPPRLAALAAAATALFAGAFLAREGSRVAARHVERLLGAPALLRETSRPRGPLAHAARAAAAALRPPPPPPPPEALFRDVVLPQGLRSRLATLASSLAAARSRGAPLRNLLLHGPPGTGKTLVAQRLARAGGLDYAVMSGGDVAPLGAAAVTRLHDLFDWAATTPKGVLLFIDEADAFLGARGGAGGGDPDASRAALNALLFRTGAPSASTALVLATNRAADLDEAVLDRMDEALLVPRPGRPERRALLRLYFRRYILAQTGGGGPAPDGDVRPASLLRRLAAPRPAAQPPPIAVAPDVTEALLDEAADAADGFSGRELAKLVASVQAAVYGAPPPLLLTAATLRAVLADKLAEHTLKRSLVAGRG